MKSLLIFLSFNILMLIYLSAQHLSFAYDFDCGHSCEEICAEDRACLLRCFTCCPVGEVNREVDCRLCGGRWEGERCLSQEASMVVKVRVNGNDFPGQIAREENIRITVSLNNQGVNGRGDYFLWIKIPDGSCFCYPWAPCSCDNPSPGYQGEIVSFSEIEIPPEIPCAFLPSGTYRLFFGVDLHPNGFFDPDAIRDEIVFTIP